VEPDLAEWDYGDCEGLRSDEIRVWQPGWDIWADGCRGGEAPEDVGLRADRLIAKLSTLGGAVALFSHGQFGRVLAARWIGQAVSTGRHFEIAPATIGILGFDPDRGAHGECRVIRQWNAAPSAAWAGLPAGRA